MPFARYHAPEGFNMFSPLIYFPEFFAVPVFLFLNNLFTLFLPEEKPFL